MRHIKIIKNILKRSFCIFLTVIVLILTVNNSYLSPYAMGTVNASGIVAVGVYITVDMVIKLICAIGVSCLGAGLINELVDMDFNAVINNVHDWLQDNIGILDKVNIDGTSALKEWAQADSWSVIDGAGGNPEPNPSPPENDDKVHLPDPFTLTSLAGLGSVAIEEFYKRNVAQEDIYNDIAEAYVDDKIKNYTNIVNPSNDVISESFNKAYGEREPSFLTGYNGAPTMQTDGKYHFVVSQNYGAERITANIVNEDSKFGGYIENRPYYGYQYKLDMYRVVWDSFVQFYFPNGDPVYRDRQDSACFKAENLDGTWVDMLVNCSFPIFNNQSDYLLWKNGDTSISPINKNYIDSDDDYGWASTANISPSDLAQSMVGLRDKLNDKQVSFEHLLLAINALKAQLEDKNPNTNPAVNPIPYPTVDDYKNIYENVISDPIIFPNKNPNPVPSTAPNPEPSASPDIGESKDYTGLLGVIINLLKNILQAITDILSFLTDWFLINPASIKSHLLRAIEISPTFNGFEPLLAYIEDFRGAITDTYDYPVIKVKTPNILLPYYKNEEITLIDFEDYATYFIWVRTFLAFSICFGFGLWIIKDIKIAFTLN